MSGGILGVGRDMENSAMRGLSSAASAESGRNMANDSIRAQKIAADKSRTATLAGIGAYAAPKVAEMMAPPAATTLESAGLSGSMIPTGNAGAAITGNATAFAPAVAPVQGGMAASGEAIGSTAIGGLDGGLGAAGTASGITSAGSAASTGAAASGGMAAEAGAASMVPGIGWAAAAGLGIYALGSMFDWW